MTIQELSQNLARADARDPNHHLWRNGRFWWIAFTVHTPDWRAHRLRFSLRTDDLDEARERRDRVLAWYAEHPECDLSIRFTF